MIVLMFKPQFAQLVATGTKLQTVRPVRKRAIKVGESVVLRRWSGLPYRSKQVDLLQSVITRVEPIQIGRGLIWNGGEILSGERLEAFARADGFANADKMFAWFDKTHGLPFEGIVINWAP